MRALRLHGPGELRLEEVPAPSSEAVIAVEACGVCGSDLHFVDGSARTDHLPITLGHEVAGTVVTAPHLAPGTPVIAEVGGFCGSCPRCVEGRSNLCERASVLGIDIDGGFADYVAVPAGSVVVRPEEVSPGAAATAVDAGATALHAVRRRGGVGPGDTVVVIGVGGLGLYGLQLARQAGAGAVIAADVRPEALQAASGLGADETLVIEPGSSIGRAVKLLTEGGADVAFEFVGAAATVDGALKSIRPGGRAVVVGVGAEPVTTLPAVLWSNNEYTLTGSYGSLPGDAAHVLEMLATGEVTAPPITEVGLDEAADALEAMAAGDLSVAGRAVVVP